MWRGGLSVSGQTGNPSGQSFHVAGQSQVTTSKKIILPKNFLEISH